MSKTKVLDFEVKDGNLILGVDSNKDGENVVSLRLKLSEAVEEAIARGKPIEGVKAVSLEFKGTKLLLKVDTDRDGEQLLEIEIDLGEAFDEISDAVSKSKS